MLDVLARVHLYPPDHCAGAEMMLHELLKALVGRGHRCQVWLSKASRTKQPYELDGIEVHPHTDDHAWFEPAQRASVLLTHLDNTHKVVAAALAWDKPLVQILHNTHPATRMWATCKADLLVANSEWMAEDFGRPEHMIVVRPPVRAEDYRVPRVGRGGGITLVNLNQLKGGVLFAQLAALLPHRRFIGVRGAYGEQLDLDLPNVEIVPHASVDMRKVYRATRLVLMPSIYESWGRVGVEAMASGIPVIAHPTPGLKESLGGAGIFADRADPRRWVSVIENLLNRPLVYELASRRAATRSRELDPTEDLARWVEALERLEP